jgi:hypothetical protein
MGALRDWFGLPDSLPGSFDPTHGWTLSWVLPLVVTALALGYALATRRPSGRAHVRIERGLDVVLAVSAVLAAFTYADFGLFRHGTFLNEWDVYYYYLGSKYAPEVGYTELYNASLIADVQTGRKFAHPEGTIRRLPELDFVPAERVLAEREHHLRRFTPERWRQFVADSGFFEDIMPVRKWSGILRDHGYNGSPAWSALMGTLFTRHLSIRDPVQRGVLLAIDPLLFLVAFIVVARAFGWRVLALCMVLIGTHYLMSWGHLKGSLLRTDFALFSVMAIAQAHQGRFRGAGVLLGLATLSRLFPAVLLVGPAVQGLWKLLARRELDRDLLRLGTSFVITVLAGVGFAAVYGGDTPLWSEWIVKLRAHYGALVHWNVGYRVIADTDWQSGVPELVRWSQVLAEEPLLLALQNATLWGTRLIVVLPTLLFMRWLKTWESMALGFVLFFMLMQASYYYYLFLIVPMLFFAGHVRSPAHAVGVGLLLLSGAMGYLLFSGHPALSGLVMFRGWKQFFPTYYFMSWCVGVVCFYMVLVAGIQASRARRQGEAASDG